MLCGTMSWSSTTEGVVAFTHLFGTSKGALAERLCAKIYLGVIETTWKNQ